MICLTARCMGSEKTGKPLHIGIILDGNRRFAKKLGQNPWDGHQKGAEKVEMLFQWCKDLDIKELTLYTFSMQNFNRDKDEVDHLMSLFTRFFGKKDIKDKVTEHRIRVRFIGRTHLFRPEVKAKIDELEEFTRDFSDYTINFAFGYGGREEITDAAKKLAKDVKAGTLDPDDIDESTFASYLYTDHDPDFIIRTGGSMRTSNFLPWQSIYSEWFFLEKTWPEFEKEDLLACIDEFSGKRERRFGR